MTRVQRGSSTGALVALGVIWLSCQGPLVATEGGFYHEDIGYRIALPKLPAAEHWKRVALTGTDLAFQRESAAGVSTVSLMSDCGGTAASPGLLARNLRLGLGRIDLEQSMPIAYRGYPGWEQSFRARLEEVPVFVKAVTVQVGVCTFDWVLVTPDESTADLAAFDGWWPTFEPGERVERSAEAS